MKQEAFEDSSFYLAVTDTLIEAKLFALFWQHVDAWIQAVQRKTYASSPLRLEDPAVPVIESAKLYVVRQEA